MSNYIVSKQQYGKHFCQDNNKIYNHLNCMMKHIVYILMLNAAPSIIVFNDYINTHSKYQNWSI